MLHQCSHSGGGSAMAPCSCGFLHGACGAGGASFSILFPMSGKQPIGEAPGSMSPASSSVDCTLSLGTPSTRQSEKTLASTKTIQHSSCVPGFCWDILSQSSRNTSAGARGNTGNSSNLGGDPLLLARRCANCDTTSTPLWRNGPRGPKSLCNACGIRYKKEERRAAASTASPSAADPVIGYGYQRPAQQPWGCYSPATLASKGNSISMSFAGSSEEGRHDDEDDAEVPYLSWRLNVVPPTQFTVGERPSLFQYQY